MSQPDIVIPPKHARVTLANALRANTSKPDHGRPGPARALEAVIYLATVAALLQMTGRRTDWGQWLPIVALMGSLFVGLGHFIHRRRLVDSLARATAHFVAETRETSRLRARVQQLESELTAIAEPERAPILEMWAFLTLLGHDITLSRRTSVSMCMLVIQPGHGDTEVRPAVLEQLATVFSSRIRQSDQIALMGGTRLALLLHNTTIADAEPVCEDWLRLHRASAVPLSAGLTELNADRDTAASFLKRATLALEQSTKTADHSLCIIDRTGRQQPRQVARPDPA